MLSCLLGSGESLEGREARPRNMSDFDYESLLDRARENIPEEISSRSRWRLPAPQIMIEGSNTIFRNFNEVVSMMDRDENHVYQYILNELGTRGLGTDRGLVSKAASTQANQRNDCQLRERYIKCSQCSAPDTHFVKEDRTTLLKCQACGATRPVKL